MKNPLLYFLFVCFTSSYQISIAQVCGTGTDNLPGCFMCVNTVTGNTGGYTHDIDPWPNAACGWENSVWFQFCNKNPTCTFSLTGFNFTNSPGPPPLFGMEFAILDKDLNVLSAACGNSPFVSVSSPNFIPGELYYICVSGYNADVFDFVITVDDVNGIPDPSPRTIFADPNDQPYCEGQIVEFNINPYDCVTNYNWTLPPGSTILSGANTESILVEIGPVGGAICITASNPCGSSPPSCKQITVEPIPPVVYPPIEVCAQSFPYTYNGEVFNGPGVFTKTYPNSRGCDSTSIYTINQILITPTNVPAQYFCVEDFPLFFQGNYFNGPGPHTRVLPSYQGCDSTVSYLFLTYPSLTLPFDTTICKGECVVFNNQQFCNQGIFNAVNPNADGNGCDIQLSLNLQVVDPIAQIETPAILGCDPNATITLSSFGSSTGQGVNYQWTTRNGRIVGSNTSQNITVSAPGTYTLDVTMVRNGVMCSTSSSVTVTSNGSAPEQPQFETPGNNICSGNTQSYILDANPNATSYSWSVNPASPFSTSGDTIEVNWIQSGPSEICVVASNACGDSDTTCLNVNVIASPDAEFGVIDTLCQTDSALVIFTGSADTSATINWTLNNASGTPADTFYLNWPTGGLKALGLNITQNGCSDTYAQNIWVQAPLATPMLNCTPGLNEITFSWDTIPGADGYTIFVDSVSQGSTQDLNFTVSGLSGMDTILFEVFANDTSICLPTSAALTCVARECPPVSIDISPVNTICRDASTTPVQLNYSLSGNGNNGTVSWSGNGIDNSGLFDPTAVNQGPTNLTLTYEEDGCTFMESISVEVFDIPEADFSIDQIICVSESADINYTGTASLNANFIWDFDNGNVISGSGSGPYQIDWNNPGTYQVDLFVEENGCNSPLVSKNIQIDAPLATPVLNCETSVSDILFTWDNIPNALDYQVNVLNGMSGTQTGNEYSISGLMVNETVTIELIVSGNTVCGPSKDTLTCQTQDCPDVQVEIEPVSAICYDGNQNSIQLNATLSGNMHQGSFSWSGPGVDASGNFNPNHPAFSARW
ncbi:MAG: hypothetical protein R2784_19980 [Saprospiraceae bacterium]